MSSIKPNNGCDELDSGEKIPGCLVVSGGNRAELFKFGEEILDQMARLVEVPVVVTGGFAVCLGRDDQGLGGVAQRLNDTFIGIECFVGDQRVGLHGWQQLVGTVQIMGLTAGQAKVDGIAQCVDQGVDFGAQPPTRSTDGLVFAVFLGAPALC